MYIIHIKPAIGPFLLHHILKLKQAMKKEYVFTDFSILTKYNVLVSFIFLSNLCSSTKLKYFKLVNNK